MMTKCMAEQRGVFNFSGSVKKNVAFMEFELSERLQNRLVLCLVKERYDR